MLIVHIEQNERKLPTLHIIRHTLTTSADVDQNACCVRSFSGRQERYDFRHFLNLSGTPNGVLLFASVEKLKQAIEFFSKYTMSCSDQCALNHQSSALEWQLTIVSELFGIFSSVRRRHDDCMTSKS